MSIYRLLASCEPTHVLQVVIGRFAVINQATEMSPYKKIPVQEFFSLAATLVGVAATTSEVFSLGLDLLCKAGKNTVGATQYVMNPPWLDRTYQALSHRPSLAFRVERILSQTLGVIGSLLGSILVLVDQADWTVELQRHLKNYTPQSSPLSANLESSERPPLHVPEANDLWPELEPEISDESHDSVAEEPASHAPPPPPAPKLSAPAAATPKQSLNMLEEIVVKGGKERKVFTMRGRKKEGNKPANNKFLTMRSAVRAGLLGENKPLRIQSKMIEYSVEGYRVKGSIILSEAVDDLGLDFHADEEQLSDTLDAYIFNKNGGGCKVGDIFEIKDENSKESNFTIKVLEADKNGTVEKVLINYMDTEAV